MVTYADGAGIAEAVDTDATSGGLIKLSLRPVRGRERPWRRKQRRESEPLRLFIFRERLLTLWVSLMLHCKKKEPNVCYRRSSAV
jgi:hypothetical protein